MRDWKHPLLRSRMERLRIGILLVLGVTCVGLLAGAGRAPATRETEAKALPLTGMVVVLDPGHGGYDGGARAQDSGVWEKELTLRIALATEQELLRRGAQVVLTRREDCCLAPGQGATKARKRADLKARTEMAQAAGAHVFLSIHLNEYRSRAESGPQVFYRQGSQAGRQLAEVLQQALIAGLKPSRQRSAMAGDYYVLRSGLPAVLVECGFLSNAAEEKLLLDEAYRRQIACALADGLEAYRLQPEGVQP